MLHNANDQASNFSKKESRELTHKWIHQLAEYALLDRPKKMSHLTRKLKYRQVDALQNLINTGDELAKMLHNINDPASNFSKEKSSDLTHKWDQQLHDFVMMDFPKIKSSKNKKEI
jgi:hypothetical protein